MDTLPSLEDECFFIAPIGEEGSPERDRSDGVLEFIVGRAAEELGLVAVRADQLAEPGQITLQVIEHVLGAKAVVADLTGLNPNVFYELAIRHAARQPVALIAEKGCSLPFDIAQMRTISFDYTDLRSADQCRKDIVAHLRQGIENGAVDSPVATTIDVRTLQGGSAVERNVAELVTSMEELTRMQRDQSLLLDRLSREGAGARARDIHPQAVIDIAESVAALEQLAEEREDQELASLLRELRPAARHLRRTVTPTWSRRLPQLKEDLIEVTPEEAS